MNIELRYCSAWGYEPKAVSLTDKLLTRFKTKIKNYNLIPSTGGCFELTVDGDLLYSKLKTGHFPDEQEMIEQVAAKARK